MFALQLVGDPSNASDLKRIAFTVPDDSDQNATYNFDFDHPVACFDIPSAETAQDTANHRSYEIAVRHPSAGKVVVTATKTRADANFDFVELDLAWPPQSPPFASIDISVHARAHGESGSLSLHLTRASH